MTLGKSFEAGTSFGVVGKLRTWDRWWDRWWWSNVDRQGIPDDGGCDKRMKRSQFRAVHRVDSWQELQAPDSRWRHRSLPISSNYSTLHQNVLTMRMGTSSSLVSRVLPHTYPLEHSAIAGMSRRQCSSLSFCQSCVVGMRWRAGIVREIRVVCLLTALQT